MNIKASGDDGMDATIKIEPRSGVQANDPRTAPNPSPCGVPAQATTDPLQKILERARQGDQNGAPRTQRGA